MPKYIWHPLTWIVHGGIQWAFYEIDPGFAWGFLPVWYYRDRYKDHRGNPPERWPLDGWLDVLVPCAVQVVRFLTAT
jgi:hypothetical protein